LTEAYPFPFIGRELDFRPLLQAVAEDRVRGRDMREIARSFQRGMAQGLHNALNVISRGHGLDTVVLSGGVFQNELLMEDLKSLLANRPLQVWTNHAVPTNDGGISLGQGALAAFGQFDTIQRADEHTSEPTYA
jgi:hydrogenase maturation protein HypF